MTTETTAQEKSAQAAFDHLAATVYHPVFFSKLAAHGIQPRTDAEKVELLKIGEYLLQENALKEEQQAASTASNLSKIASRVAGRIQKLGAAVPGQPVADELPSGLQAHLNKLAADANTSQALDIYKAALQARLGQ